MQEQLPIIPKETKSVNASKIDRVEQRLVGRFHAGLMLVPSTLPYRSEYDGKTHDFVKEFKLEYLQFPYCEHDDILDCASQLFEDLATFTKGIQTKEAKNNYVGTAQYWDDYYEMIDKQQRNNPFLSRGEAMELIRRKKWRKVLHYDIR